MKRRVLFFICAVTAVGACLAIWNLSNSSCNMVVKPDRLGSGSVNGGAWSADGKILATASSNGIYLHDAEALNKIRFISTNSWINKVAFSPDGHMMASWDENALLQLWDIRSGQHLQDLGCTSDENGFAFNVDGRFMAIGNTECTRLVDTTTGS